MDCIFCEIIKGDVPSYTLYDDEMVKVFLDVNPDSTGHTLIIPKGHYVNFEDIPLEVLNHIMEVAKEMYAKITERLKPDGIKFVQNNGCIQEVKHYHLHIIPIYKRDKKMKLEEVFEILK